MMLLAWHTRLVGCQVEARLAEKEEQSLEKDLILQQVNRLVDRVSTQINDGKQDTLKLAKKVSLLIRLC